jgi:hypothetical protein
MFHWQREEKWLSKIHSQSCGNMSTQNFQRGFFFSPVIQNLLSKCSESEFYHYYVLLWEISFLFTDETQHKMLHGFSCKHYTYTSWVKSIIFPTLSILQGYLFLNILILL